MNKTKRLLNYVSLIEYQLQNAKLTKLINLYTNFTLHFVGLAFYIFNIFYLLLLLFRTV